MRPFSMEALGTELANERKSAHAAAQEGRCSSTPGFHIFTQRLVPALETEIL